MTDTLPPSKTPRLKSLSHNSLVNFVRTFAPNISRMGVCYGFSHLWMQAVLTGKHQEAEFYARLDCLTKYLSDQKKAFYDSQDASEDRVSYRESYDDLKEKIDEIFNSKKNLPAEKNLTLHEDEKFLVGLRAFSEAIALCQAADTLGVFPEAISQNAMSEVFPLVQSDALKSASKTMHSTLLGVTVASKQELTHYFDALQKIISEEPDDSTNLSNAQSGFILTSENHAYCMYFHTGTQKWRFLDINQLDGKENYYAEVNTSDLASLIFTAAQDQNSSDTALAIRYTTLQSELNTKEAIETKIKALREVALPLNPTQTNSRGVSILQLAAQCDDAHTLNLLIEQEADINQIVDKKTGHTALMQAAIQGSLNAVNALIKAKALIDQSSLEGSTALMLAITNGYTAVSQALLAATPKPNLALTNNEGETALTLASQHGHTAVVLALLATGEITLDDKNNALLLAAMNGHSAIVTALLASSPPPDINIKNNFGQTPLMLAATFLGDLSTTSILLKAGAKSNNILTNLANIGVTEYELCLITELPETGTPNARKIYLEKVGQQIRYFMLDTKNREIKGLLDINADELTSEFLAVHKIEIVTELSKRSHIDEKIAIFSDILTATLNANTDSEFMLAVAQGNTTLVELLLSSKPYDDSVVDQDGHTALMLAVKNGHTAIIQRLLNAGASLASFNQQGETALMIGLKNNYPNLEQLLGPEINKINVEGDTALTLAIKKKNSKIAAELIRRGATGDNALALAIKYNQPDLVNLLLPLANYHSKIAALMQAAENNQPPSLSILLASGVEINETDSSGNTALMLAAEQGHMATVLALIAAGADVNEKNKQGLDALTLASNRGHSNIIRVLIKNKAVVDPQNERLRLIEISEELNDPTLPAELALAAQHGDFKTISTAIKDGKELNKADKHGFTLLMLAAQHGHIRIVDDLLRAGANTSAVNLEGDTALILAINQANPKDKNFLNLLLSLISSSPANVINKEGKTALMLAAERGYSQIIPSLISLTYKTSKLDLLNPILFELINKHCDEPSKKTLNTWIRRAKRDKSTIPVQPIILSTTPSPNTQRSSSEEPPLTITLPKNTP